MARVVERRRGIPWALIAFVFLFLVAATVAVLKTMSDDEKKLAIEKKDKDIELLTRGVSPTDLEVYYSRARAPGGKGVVRQAEARPQPLYDRIVGQGTTPATLELAMSKFQEIQSQAAAAAAEGGAAGTESTGLVEAFKAKAQEIKECRDKIADLEKQSADAVAQAKALKDKVTAVEAEQAKEAKAYQDDVAKLREANTAVDDAHKSERAEMKKGFEARIEALTVEKAQLQGDIEKLRAQVHKKDSEIGTLRKKLESYERPARMRTVAFQSDGKVIQTKPEDNIVYISIGTKDRVLPGLTFSVYSADRGMPQVRKEDGSVVEAAKLRGKAQIYVLQPFEKISMCRIEWLASAGDPVIAGDMVANLAFDAARTYRFVVIGDFDLYGVGKAQDSDAEYIKHLITRFRGDVSKELDDQTDFLVVGTKPADVPSAEGEETAQMTKVRQEKEKRRAQYDQILTAAKARDIPVLNLNEFLALVGYTAQNPQRAFGSDQR